MFLCAANCAYSINNNIVGTQPVDVLHIDIVNVLTIAHAV